jgi:predicted peroxiredoxin
MTSYKKLRYPRWAWICAAAAASLTACAATSLATATATQSTGALLTIITTADPQTQLMALVLTRSAMEAGERPHIMLCSAGGDLALKDAPASATAPLQPKGASPQGLLAMLMASGVRVEVCAIYLPNRRVEADALLEGIGVAKPEELGALIASPGQTILSF